MEEKFFAEALVFAKKVVTLHRDSVTLMKAMVIEKCCAAEELRFGGLPMPWYARVFSLAWTARTHRHLGDDTAGGKIILGMS